MSRTHMGNVPTLLATELATRTFTDLLCEMDMRQLKETKQFLENQEQYYLLANCWLHIIYEAEGAGVMMQVKQLMRQKGLIGVIKLASNTADYVISVLSERPITPSDGVLGFESLFTQRDIRKLLTCLRFPKRFTLIKSQTLMESTYAVFEKIQARLNWRAVAKSESSDPDVWWPRTDFDEWVKGYLYRMTYNWKSFYNSEPGFFSNGATSDGATLVSKLKGYALYSSYLDDPMFPFPYFGYWPFARMQSDTAPADPLVVIAVPKSYKTYRIIAPESAYNNFNMQKLRRALEAALASSGYGRYFPIDDQSIQQARAYASSLTGDFATIDSTSASDSIATYRMRDLLDPELFELLSGSRPKKYRFGKKGKTVTASTWLTSGHPCTFVIEGMFFLAIAFVARDMHAWWTGEWGRRPSVFGDDLIVDMIYIDEVLYLLDLYGIQVNYEKSFSQGKYRESCGVEYYDGIPTRSTYWPRKGISERHGFSTEDYESLVELQHRLYDNFRGASNFLSEFIMLQWPAVTSSLPGSEYVDLWAPVPHCGTTMAPYGAYWKEGYKKTALPERIAEVATREVHFGPKNTYKSSEDYTDIMFCECYHYYRFLAEGPTYADEFSKLLGVSEPRPTGSDYVRPERVLRMQK